MTDPDPLARPAEPGPPPGRLPRPGRYQRSVPGLLGALLVTLLVIGAFVAFRAINRANQDTPVEPVDYLAAVQGAQRDGFDPAYPPTLPQGWRATSVTLTLRDDSTAWDLGILTSDGRFVGLRQSTAQSVDALVSDLVDLAAQEGGTVSVPDAMAPQWRTFSDAGGDLAFGAEVDGEAVLVYGSAAEDDLLRLLSSLTQAPVDAGT
ncbi:MAG: DUF4245 family protein [Nocardioides sp.]